MGVDIVKYYADSDWLAGQAGAVTQNVEADLEQGGVLCFTQLPFALGDDETRFLDGRWADGKAKNINIRPSDKALRGASGSIDELAALKQLITRFRDHSQGLVHRLFPHYAGQLRLGSTSFRPIGIEGRVTSWRKDDTRLHVDAFPANPTRGVRLLRVFSNVNPQGEPRVWRVGEPFADFAKRYWAALPPPVPGWAWLQHKLSLTRKPRSAYDHYMLMLHDRAKADTAYQRDAPQQTVKFAPGTTWVVFSDQVLHAAMSGQFMFEQTFMLDVEAQQDPSTSPLRTLERLAKRALV